MIHQTSQMPREIYTPIEVILMITTGKYDNIVLFAEGDHYPLEAIEHILRNRRMCDKLNVKEFEPRTLNVW